MTWRLLALPPLPARVLQDVFGDPRLELVTPPERTQAAVETLLPTVDLVVGDWSHTLRIDDPGPRVALVHMPSVGVDVIDLDRCAARAVPVTNCAGANTTSVAEWCVSATLALLRRTVEADAAVRRGEWPQTELRGRELAGSRVGVLGMGSIGRRVAELFGLLGCAVAYWSRSRHEDAPATYAELDELVATSDVLVTVIALSEQTRGIVDARLLDRAKPGLLLVNAGRGALVDEPALLAALQSGQVGGAALDVFATEPLPPDSPLRDAPAVLLSPHMAGSTRQASVRILEQTRANLQRALAGEPVQNVVNGQSAQVRRREPPP
jgi:phosphoglycerate dehydrogenase-like enzyme